MSSPVCHALESQSSLVPFDDAERWGGESGLCELQEVDDEIIGTLPLDRLSEFRPLETSPWSEAEGICHTDVRLALDAGNLETEPYSSSSQPGAGCWTKEKHAARIAYLVLHPSEEAIVIEFTEPSEPWMELTDGWHRLAAAQFADLESIKVSIAGFVDHSVSGLGAICRSFQKLENEAVLPRP